MLAAVSTAAAEDLERSLRVLDGGVVVFDGKEGFHQRYSDEIVD